MNALRGWSVEQQVGLLFVVLFGTLGLATLVGFAHSLRDLPRERQVGIEAARRELRAVWVGAVLFWAAWATGAAVATLLFAVLSFLTLREYITLTHTRRADHRALIAAFFVVLPLQYLLVGLRAFNLFTVFVPVYAFAALPALAALGNDPTRFVERTAKIQWGIAICVYGLSHAPALLLLDIPGHEGRGAFLVLYLVLVVGVAHLVQALAERRLRARPAARRISRHFAWERFGLGALGGGAAGGVMAWATPFTVPEAVLIGTIAGACALFGGLVVQALQRDAGLRQWGAREAVTGAYGLLSRVAPLGFAAPVFFHSVRWYFGA